MRKRWRGAPRAAVAVAAAYALALHAIVAALALGAAPATLDPVHALCAPDDAGSDGRSNAPVHAHDVACCVVHAAGGALPPPSGPALRARAPVTVGMPERAASTALPSPASFSPLGARAPPRLV